MILRMRALLLVVASTGAALAQPPGQVMPGPPAPLAPAQPSVMDRRWGVGMAVGWLTLRPEDYDGDPLTFGMAELHGRYRILPFLEIGLSLVGGGAAKGDLSTAGLYIDGRYRFFAERPWNFFAFLSLGVASVAPDEDATDDEKAGRGSLRLGFGVERRFRWIGVHADVRLIGIGENKDYEPAGTSLTELMIDRGVSGGSITFGGTIYF